MAIQRVEVITGRAARRRYSEEEKRGLVEAAFAPGVKPAEYARRTGMDLSLLYRWRRELSGRQARLPAFLPVAVMAEEDPPAAAATLPDVAPGLVEVEFPGGIRVRITGDASPAVVTAALAALARLPA
jgi:transposase